FQSLPSGWVVACLVTHSGFWIVELSQKITGELIRVSFIDLHRGEGTVKPEYDAFRWLQGNIEIYAMVGKIGDIDCDSTFVGRIRRVLGKPLCRGIHRLHRIHMLGIENRGVD